MARTSALTPTPALPATLVLPTHRGSKAPRSTPAPSPVPRRSQALLLRPIVTATLDRRLDQRELELAWGCQVMVHDLLSEHGLAVAVDRRPVVQTWRQGDLANYAADEASRLDMLVPVAVLSRFDRSAAGGVRAECVVVDVAERHVVTRSCAEASPSRLMSWLAHVPDHVAFALGAPTPKYAWREVLGIRDPRRALGQVRLAGALARLARLGPAAAA